MAKEITIISADDWTGIYLGENLVCEGHSIDERELLENLGYTVDWKEADNEWLEGEGYLPKKLDDVVFRKR